MFTFAHADADAGIVAGHVTALAFCTDPLLEPYLISATERGTIAVWNLNTRSLQSLHSGAHEGAVSGVANRRC